MYTICKDCENGGRDNCGLYICQTKDGFIFISCIVFAIELDAYILQRVALDLGGENEMPDM